MSLKLSPEQSAQAQLTMFQETDLEKIVDTGKTIKYQLSIAQDKLLRLPLKYRKRIIEDRLLSRYTIKTDPHLAKKIMNGYMIITPHQMFYAKVIHRCLCFTYDDGKPTKFISMEEYQNTNTEKKAKLELKYPQIISRDIRHKYTPTFTVEYNN